MIQLNRSVLELVTKDYLTEYKDNTKPMSKRLNKAQPPGKKLKGNIFNVENLLIHLITSDKCLHNKYKYNTYK